MTVITEGEDLPTTDEENMMTPEEKQVKRLIIDSLKHDLKNNAMDSNPREMGFFSEDYYENLAEYLVSQASFFKGEADVIQERINRYIQHVSLQPDGARQLLEKYGLYLSNYPGDKPPTSTVKTP